MFIGYKIINNVLCLYVDENYEFGGINSNNKDSVKEKILDYIKKYKIKFNGTKVILLVSGLMIGSVILNNDYQSNNYDVYNGSNYVMKYSNSNKNEGQITENSTNITYENINQGEEIKDTKEVNNINLS